MRDVELAMPLRKEQVNRLDSGALEVSGLLNRPHKSVKRSPSFAIESFISRERREVKKTTKKKHEGLKLKYTIQRCLKPSRLLR